MEQSDKKLVKSSILNTVDVIASNIPGLNIARGLAKALLSNGLVMRQDRVLEFVQFIIDNKGKFTKDLMETEEFQDGFVFCIEQYIRERNKNKRLITQKIFLGFATSENKENFELERYLNVLGLLNIENLTELLNIKETISRSKLDGYDEFPDLGSGFLGGQDRIPQHFNDLMSLGIIYFEYTEVIWGESFEGLGVEYKLTLFGYAFLDFLTK